MSYTGNEFILNLNGSPVGGVTVINQEKLREVLENTASNHLGRQNFHGKPGRKGTTLNIEGFLNSANRVQWQTINDSDSNAAITLTDPLGGTISAADGFALSGLSMGTPEKELTTFSATLQSSGAVSYVPPLGELGEHFNPTDVVPNSNDGGVDYAWSNGVLISNNPGDDSLLDGFDYDLLFEGAWKNGYRPQSVRFDISYPNFAGNDGSNMGVEITILAFTGGNDTVIGQASINDFTPENNIFSVTIDLNFSTDDLTGVSIYAPFYATAGVPTIHNMVFNHA